MSSHPPNPRHPHGAQHLMDLARRVIVAADRMDAFSSLSTAGNRSVVTAHYNELMAHVRELKSFME